MMDLPRLVIAALLAITATACQTAPPVEDCDALTAEYREVAGVHDYFVDREGELGPNATEAYDQMLALNDRVQESCR